MFIMKNKLLNIQREFAVINGIKILNLNIDGTIDGNILLHYLIESLNENV